MLTDALPDGLDNKLNLILTLFPDSLVVKSLLATLTKIPGYHCLGWSLKLEQSLKAIKLDN